MRIILFILFTIQISTVFAGDAHSAWVCSDKLNMVFYGSDKNSEGIYLLKGNDGVVLELDFNRVDSIIIIPIKYKNGTKHECERESIIYGQRFHLTFFTPFDGKKISTIIRKQTPEFFNKGVRDYIFIVRKKENGKQVNYYKNFTFIEDSTQW